MYCLVSALAYTLSNICMRELSVLRCDVVWAVFNREAITALMLAPWVLRMAVRGQKGLPSGRGFWELLAAGFQLQLVGNMCSQWAFGVVGLSVTIPVYFGAVIVCGAILGRLWLDERVSQRSMAAMLVLVIALTLLGQGAETAGKAIASAGAGTLLLAVLAAGVSGTSSGLLAIAVRRSVQRAIAPVAIGFWIPFTGALALGPLCLSRLGIAGILDTPSEQAWLMLGAGGLNLIGFLSFIRGLQHITVVRANLVNASQVAMAAVAGMLIFREPPNFWLLAGIVLTIVGILQVGNPSNHEGF
ncbi:MAG: DMT family transporter [Planctomycetaceae bacterium]|nr:DMT family transporter [Planctomycetaceae bacterium]